MNDYSIDVSLYDNIIMAGGNSTVAGYTESLKHTVIPFARDHVRLLEYDFNFQGLEDKNFYLSQPRV